MVDSSTGPLPYEVNMLLRTAMLLQQSVARSTDPGEAEAIYNALLESFVLHARNLWDFAYRDSPRYADDVYAGDFFDEPSEWIRKRPAPSPLLKSIGRRANKLAAHLTYSRLALKKREELWQFGAIANELATVIGAFQEAIKDSRLAAASDERPRTETDPRV